jgi:hypothetical protein
MAKGFLFNFILFVNIHQCVSQPAIISGQIVHIRCAGERLLFLVVYSENAGHMFDFCKKKNVSLSLQA